MIMEKEISALIAELLNVDEDTVKGCKNIMEELAVNSLKLMQITDAIEDTYGIRIDIRRDTERLGTVKSIAGLVSERRSQ